MPNPIRIIVNGHPKPWQRSRQIGKRHFTDPVEQGWRSCIWQAAHEHAPAVPMTCALRVWVQIFIKRPKRLERAKDSMDIIPAVTGGDVDNYAKSILDTLTDLGYWADDRLVQDLRSQKYYTARKGVWLKPGALILIWRIDDDRD